MVLDNLDHSEKYNSLNPLFEKAFRFLKNFDPAKTGSGKHEIEGEKLFALVSQHEDYAPNNKLEAHRRYIDIQFLQEGTDLIGWKETSTCEKPMGDFNSEKDVILFEDGPLFNIKVEPGCFVIFWPGDAHAPLMGHDKLFKVVLKVEQE